MYGAKRVSSNFLAVAEIRFSAGVDVSNFIMTAQEYFSNANYDQVSVLKNQSMKTEQFGEQNMLVPTVHKIYSFTNRDATRQFILNEHCLVFKVTDFQDFDSFMALFQEGIYLVNKLIHIVSSQRMGLRLCKRIMPRSGLGLKDYLQQSEAKLLARFGGLSGYSHTELTHQFNGIHLLHRVKTSPHSGLELPKDIHANDMAFNAEVLAYHGPSIFLDSDGFVEKYQDLSLPTVKDNLKNIHAILGLAFQSSVSDLALSEIGFR